MVPEKYKGGLMKLFNNSLPLDNDTFLTLLSEFKKPRRLDRYQGDNYYIEIYKENLNEHPTKTISKMTKEGLLIPANLEQRVDLTFKLTELKTLCKDYGLKISVKRPNLSNDSLNMRPKNEKCMQ